MGNKQSQPSPLPRLLGGKKWIKDLGQICLSDPRTIIAKSVPAATDLTVMHHLNDLLR